MDGQSIKTPNACEEKQIAKPGHKLWQQFSRQIGNARKDERDRAEAHKIGVTVLATRRDLERVVCGLPVPKLSTGWRSKILTLG